MINWDRVPWSAIFVIALFAGIVVLTYYIAGEVDDRREYSVHEDVPLPVTSTGRVQTSSAIVLSDMSSGKTVEGSLTAVSKVSTTPIGIQVKAFSEDQSDNGFGASLAWNQAGGYLAVGEDLFTNNANGSGRVTIWSYVEPGRSSESMLRAPVDANSASGSILLAQNPNGIFGIHMIWNKAGDQLIVTQTGNGTDTTAESYVFTINGGFVVENDVSGRVGTIAVPYSGDAGCGFVRRVDNSTWFVIASRKSSKSYTRLFQQVYGTRKANLVDYLYIDMPETVEGTYVSTVSSEASQNIFTGAYLYTHLLRQDNPGNIYSDSHKLDTYTCNSVLSEDGTSGWCLQFAPSGIDDAGIVNLWYFNTVKTDGSFGFDQFVKQTEAASDQIGSPLACTDDGRYAVYVNLLNEICISTITKDLTVKNIFTKNVPDITGNLVDGAVSALALKSVSDRSFVLFIGVKEKNTVVAVDVVLTL